MFVVKVLGGLSIENTTGSVPVGARQRRRLSLLGLLALGGERGLSREQIQAFLWPESAAGPARHALDQLLYATRRELGYEAVLSSATELRLNPAVMRVDAWAFDEAIRDARWEEASRLYAGPALNGLHLSDCAEFERWLDAERVRREQAFFEALDALAKAATARGDSAGSVRCRRQRASADPLSATAALDLIRALEVVGDRTGAIQHARIYQQLVRATLEVEPDPAVAALANEIAARSVAGHRETAADISLALPASGRGSGGSPPLAEPGAAHPSVAIAVNPTRRRISKVGRTSALVVALCSLAAVLLLRSRPLGSPSTADASVAQAHDGSRDAGQEADHPASRLNQPPDPEARSLYLRARTLWEKRTQQPLEESVVLFRLATERDPGYAAAYAGLAEAYAMLGYFGFAPGDAMFPKARAAALRALELDPAAGAAYAALGQALAWQHAWGESEAAYQRALELTPRDATAHQWYALLLAYLGRADEAAMHTGHASRLDPLSVQVNNMHGMMLYYAGDLDGALRQFENTVEAEPDSAWVRQNPWVLSNFARIAAAAGQHALAIKLIERALEVVPSHPRPLLDLAYVYAIAGKPDSARAAFARVSTTHPHYAVYRGLLHAILGERDEAFAWFDRVTEWPLPSLVQLNCEPRLRALRADPRFAKIRSQLGMPTTVRTSGAHSAR
jgi:DNA-binding SARP family transcriptional activator/Tfp pilus assembly protein PilF